MQVVRYLPRAIGIWAITALGAKQPTKRGLEVELTSCEDTLEPFVLRILPYSYAYALTAVLANS